MVKAFPSKEKQQVLLQLVLPLNRQVTTIPAEQSEFLLIFNQNPTQSMIQNTGYMCCQLWDKYSSVRSIHLGKCIPSVT